MRAILTLAAFLLLTAQPAFAKLNVLACEPEWQALAEEIGGDRVNAFSATTALQDPHHIEARPSLIAKARRADLVFCTGAELEIGWLPLLLRQSGNAKIQAGEPGYLLAASVVERIEVPTQLDRSQGDIHASGNPHVHWDPYRLLKIARAFAQRVSEIDPANADDYRQRLLDFETRWKNSIQSWEKQAASLRNKSAIVYHRNWSYLLAWLDIKVIGDLEPKPGIPATSSHLAKLLNATRSNQPDFILMANYQDDRGAQWLSEKTGVPVIRLPFTVGGSERASDLEALYSEVLTLLDGKQ